MQQSHLRPPQLKVQPHQALKRPQQAPATAPFRSPDPPETTILNTAKYHLQKKYLKYYEKWAILLGLHAICGRDDLAPRVECTTSQARIKTSVPAL